MRELSERLRDRRSRQRAIRKLERMPDEALWDLGIIRAQIRDYVHGRGRWAPEPAHAAATETRGGAVILSFPAGGRAGGRHGRAA